MKLDISDIWCAMAEFDLLTFFEHNQHRICFFFFVANDFAQGEPRPPTPPHSPPAHPRTPHAQPLNALSFAFPPYFPSRRNGSRRNEQRVLPLVPSTITLFNTLTPLVTFNHPFCLPLLFPPPSPLLQHLQFVVEFWLSFLLEYRPVVPSALLLELKSVRHLPS